MSSSGGANAYQVDAFRAYSSRYIPHCSSGITRMDEVGVLSFSILHQNLYIVVQSK
jgi:hypothetical protein